MHILHVSKKLTSWSSSHLITKYIWLILFLFILVAYSNPTFAKETKKKQSIQTTQPKQTMPIGGNEVVTGAFGITFGEDIKPYIDEQRDAERSKYVVDMNPVPDKRSRTMVLKIPANINVNELFPNMQEVEFYGSADDNDRVINLGFVGRWEHLSQICGKNGIGEVILETLREKYRITKPIHNSGSYYGGGWIEEYGDKEGNKVRLSCESSYFSVTHTSHLSLEYDERLKSEQQKQNQKQKDELKESFQKKGF